MKKLRNIFLLLLISFIIPKVCNAASISLDGTVGETIAEYTIKYTPDEIPSETIKIKIETTNDDLNYEFKSDYCSNDNNKLECTLITTTITTESDLGKIIIKNLTGDKKETTITVKATPSVGTISDVSKTFSLKALETTTVKAKSSNSNMTGINLSVGILDKTFDQNVTEYTITGIKDTINSITLTPTCDNCKYTITCPTGGCSISNSKRVALETGSNSVAINIQSEDGTSNKTYTFNIYRGDIITSSPYLKDIKIKDLVLSPKFDMLNNEYSVDLDKDLDKLDITVVAEDPTADIQIKGNEKLKDGENTITITITSSDGENKQVYTILVNKLVEEEKDTKKVVTSKVSKKNNNKWLIILSAIFALTIIIVSFILIFKKKSKNNKNDKNNKGTPIKDNIEEETSESDIIKENTDALNILEETRREVEEEEKADVDEALDDLMKTKKLELGDLDLYR